MPNIFQNILNSDEFNSLVLESDKFSDLKELNFQLQTILNNLSIQLCCSICQDITIQPFVLPSCGHSFCYSCIKHWFAQNPSCPICRKPIGIMKPISNLLLKNLIDCLLDDLVKTLQLLNFKNSKKIITNLNNWKNEKNEEFNIDSVNNFIWLNKINEKWATSIVDNEDGVPRCSACHWELIDGMCENCGRRMMGWQDRNDGDDLDIVDVDVDDESDNNNPTINRLNSDYEDEDDWNDYDNGLNDLNVRVRDNNDYDNGELIDTRQENYIEEDYESDDGFVVNDDDELEEDNSSASFFDGDNSVVNLDSNSDSDTYNNSQTDDNDDIQLVDENASGDEEIIQNYKNTRHSRKKLQDDIDEDDGEEGEEDEEEEENLKINLKRPFKKIQIDSDNDSDNENNQSFNDYDHSHVATSNDQAETEKKNKDKNKGRSKHKHKNKKSKHHKNKGNKENKIHHKKHKKDKKV